MLKKMMLLAVSVAALVAFAAPAAAQAESLIHTEFGPVETVKAVSENTVSNTDAGVLECTTVNLSSNLTTNNTETAHGALTGTATGTPGVSHTGHCASSSGLKIDITSITGTLHLTAGGTGEATFAYAYTITHPLVGPIPCIFDGTADVSYLPGDDEISLSGDLTGTSNAPCGKEGKITGDFIVTDGEGEEVTIG